MSNVKVVIGANAGDEGKGLMTDYFANEAKNRNESCIVVLSNGGAQRAHTISTPEGIRHVFHHFGSGAFANADTYLPEYFIVNPMVFCDECAELRRKGVDYDIRVPYVNRNCRITTPFDMIANQLFEENRGENKHGSCGMGIWETVRRYENGNWLRYGNFEYHSRGFGTNWLYEEELQRVKEYYEQLFKKENICMSKERKEVWNNGNLITHYIRDLEYFISRSIEQKDASILKSYDTVIFENAQGLCLDQNFGDDERYTTPSNTGLTNPAEMIRRYLPDANVEICYVTRTYLTRHGRGPMDHECKKAEINPDMLDLTNVPNPFQESLRFGKIRVDKFLARIYSDLTQAEPNWKRSLAITHLNEYPWEFPEVYEKFNNVYESSSCDRNGVIRKRGN